MNKVISREYVEKNYIRKNTLKAKITEITNRIYSVEEMINKTVDEERIYWKKEKRDLIMQRYVLRELLEDTEDEQIQKQESNNWWNKIR